jgi:transcriptional regulator with XRE-family HTH domain
MVAQSQTDSTIRIVDRMKADLGLSDAELATVLNVTPEVVRRWHSGAVALGAEPLRRLDQLEAVVAHLRETFKMPGGSRWLRSESGYLGGQRPLDALLSGQFARVEAALEALDSGIFI